MRDWRRRRPRAGPLPWVPAFERGNCVGLPALLDSCLRRNDGGNDCGRVRDERGLRALRQAQGERNLEARLRCGLVGACRRPAHLWIPAFAGTTIGGVGSSRGGGAPRRAPALGSRFRTRWEDGGTAPRRAPALGSRFRGNDGGGCAVPLAGAVSGYRTPPLWIPAFEGRNDARYWSRYRAPRRAPALGSRFRENDGGRGVRDARELRVAEETLRQAQANGISIGL